MAFAALNKSGCSEHKGNVRVRLGFYLEPTDPRYDDTWVPIVDEDGLPTGEYQLNPFHNHFVYFSPDVTKDDIKSEIEYHLPNFYKAFQDEWDKVKGGMRHGWAVEKRAKPIDYSKDATRVSQCQNRLAALTEFSHKPNMKEGQSFTATEIDVGSAASDRGSTGAAGITRVDKANSANDTGTIDTFEIWAATNMTGTNKVGTFHGSGTTYTNRDGETIGTVTAGSKQTFSGLDCDVTSGDFAGVYQSVGRLEYDTSGGSDVYYDTGDQFGTGAQTYTQMADDAISLYGTGETAGVAFIPRITSII